MKQKLLKTWLMLCLLLVGAGTSWADDVTQTYTLSDSNNGNSVTTGDVTWNIASGAITVSGSNTKLTGTITVTLPTGATLQSVEITKSSAWGSGATVTFSAGSTTLNTFSNSGSFALTSNKTNNTYTFTKTGTSSKNAWVKEIKVTYTPGDSGNGGASSNDGTYNFADMTGFSDWGTGYDKKTSTFSDGAYAELESANKSTSTITDCPVTKGNYVIFKAPTGKKISSLTFTCTQWTTKAQTITLNTSSDGTNYTATSTTSSNFVLSASDLTNVSAVKFTFSSTSNQVGIKSIKVTYASAGPAQISNLIKTSSANLYVGGEIEDLKTYLNLPNDYAGSVTFSSTNENVEIDGNYLLATGAGEATINVTAAANGNYLETTGTITLNISKKTPVIAWTNGTKASYTIFNGNDYEFSSYPTAYLTNSGPSTINYSISNDGIIIDGEPAWEAAGTYVVTAQTAETDEYNASNVLTYTIKVVNPAITMTPASGTVSAENPTVTFTGNGVKIEYIDEDTDATDKVDGTTISVDATETETYYVGITDDAGNTFNDEFDVYFLQDAGLQFSATELRVVVGTTEVEEPVLTKATDAAVTYELIYGDPEKGANVATIDPATGKLTLTGKSTETQGSVTVKATTPATDEYTAGEATYELVVYRNVPDFTWSVSEITIDQDELDQLPTPICERNITSLESSNEAVARIENKQVVFVGYGTTTITGRTTATVDYAQATASYELTFAPRYTVTFNINGEETELREPTTGAGVTAPVVEDVADYTFAGWASAAVATETTDAQTFVTLTAGKYMPTESTTLFAVYKRVEVAEGGSEDEGEFLIYADVNGTKYYMTGKPVASASTVNQILVSTTRSEATVFTINKKAESDADYSIAYDDNGTTMYLTHNTTGNYLQSSSTEVFFTFSDGAKPGTTRMLNSKRAIAFNNSANPKVFKIFSTTNLTAESTQYFDPTLEQISGGSTTYYTSTPVLEVATINVSQFQNTTLCVNRAYVMPEGLVGKTVSAKEGSAGEYNLTLTTKYEAGDVVPAGEALVVQGAEGTYTALAGATSTTKTTYPENLLVAEYTPQDTKFLTSYDNANAANYYYYKLTTKGGENFGWYYGADGGVPFLMSSKERAYLVIEKEIAHAVKGFTLDTMTEGEATAIDMVDASKNENTRIYDLQGRRVQKANRGLYIVNGKKVMFK